MTLEFRDYVENKLNEKIIDYNSLSGGDISKAYRIDTAKKSFFIKINTSSTALDMFQTEALGLNLIAKTKTINTPEVISYGCYNGNAYLILEYIEAKSASSQDFKLLGKQLAQLHQYSSEYFGLETDNYIGRLTQSNKIRKNWVDFYIEERLNPQLFLAKAKGLLLETESPATDVIKERLSVYFENVKPSLLHGDLWGGNYLISKNGTPYLIDPAVYFGHSEVDIALSKLFGGFSNDFYKAYHAIIPTDEFTIARIEIYQLYYLLAHLNMFGQSYYGSVRAVMKKYF